MFVFFLLLVLEKSGQILSFISAYFITLPITVTVKVSGRKEESDRCRNDLELRFDI